MMNKPSSFAKRLRELLDTNNMTQTDLSRATGISKSSISRYLKGDWEAKQDAVYAIARVANVNEAWLMGYDVPMIKQPAPVSEDEPLINIVKIAGRDGSYMEKQLGDKELQTLKSFIDLLPDASDDL